MYVYLRHVWESTKTRKRALNPLQLELELSTRNGNSGPLKEQQVLWLLNYFSSPLKLIFMPSVGIEEKFTARLILHRHPLWFLNLLFSTKGLLSPFPCVKLGCDDICLQGNRSIYLVMILYLASRQGNHLRQMVIAPIFKKDFWDL